MFPLFCWFYVRNIFLFSFCFVYYNILLSGGACHAQSAPTTTALYKFWDMDFTCAATHTNCLKFIAGSRLLDRFLLSFFIFICIGSTKIVSHFLRNFVERNAVRRTLHNRLGGDASAEKLRCQTLRANKRYLFFNR